MSKISIGNAVGSYQFSYTNRPDEYTLPVRIHYPIDLNGDGIQEIIFAGGETQPNTPETYTDSLVTIFGWKNNVFQNITNDWLPNQINQIRGTGAVASGDFNGDGLIDFYLGGSADMDYALITYQYINRGGYFERSDLGLSMWEHGHAVYDINGDGYDDVIPFGWSGMATPLMGSSNGLIKLSGNSIFGSGGVMADFLGNGTVSLIVVDHGNAVQDTRLFSVKYNSFSNQLEHVFIRDLPMPTLESHNFNTTNPMGKSHDVRVIALDFSKDGLPDAVVFSRGGFDGQRWVEKSAVQFLKNEGNGVFTDVTSQTLNNYHHDSYVGYNPIIQDFNLDGSLDIFHSDNSWEGTNDSTSLILGNPDGTFTDQNRKIFSDLLSSTGGMSSMVKGPNGDYYYITEEVYRGGGAEIKVYPVSFPGTQNNEFLLGSVANDRLFGHNGNNVISGLDGNDYVDGGAGVDTAVMSGKFSDYSITVNGSKDITTADSVVGRDGVDRFVNVERFRFDDGTVAVDIDSTPGQAYRLYKAALDRTPDPEGLGFWIKALDNGAGLQNVARGFVDSTEFRNNFYGDGSNAAFVTALYNNVLDRAPEQAGFDFWVNGLNNGADRAGVLVGFSESPENHANTIGLIGGGIVYQEWLA
jgi:hypothetical protein